MVEIPTTLPTRICLVRHGETEWNAERRIQGQIDIGLNDTGLRQAAAAGRWLKVAGIVALYSSDLKRAWTTAQAIGSGAGPCGGPGARAARAALRHFRGADLRRGAGALPRRLCRFRPAQCRLRLRERREPARNARPCHRQARRAGRAHPGETIAVVVHGGVLDIINRFVRGNPLEMPRDFLIPNAGLNWIVAVDGAWRIESWGETGHLEPGARDELPS